MRWGDYQLNRLETVFAVIVLLVILSAILNRAVTYFSMAERALVTSTVTNINTALRLQEAAYHARGQRDKIADLAGSNPIKLISAKPQNYMTVLDGGNGKPVIAEDSNSQPISGYIGEIDDPEPSEYARGSWYYDKSNGYLVYMVRNRELFSTTLDGPERIRFRIELNYKDRNNNGQYDDAAADQLMGIRLEPVDQYAWLL